MCLVKKPAMTEQKIAANQFNGPLSQGPVTEGGMERIRTARLRHGFYAQAPDATLRPLGQDPARFEELRDGLYQEFAPHGTLQQELVNRLARVLLLVERAERSHEGQALRRAQSAENGRDNRLHARMMRLKMTAETLRSLARSVNCWHYVTTREDLDVMKKLQEEGVAAEMGEIALDLFYQLQEPGTDGDGVTESEKRRRVVNSMRSIFGIEPIESPVAMLTPAGDQMVVYPEGYKESEGTAASDEDDDSEKDDRYPKITAEDWMARERARKLLKNILSRQAEACEAQRKALLKESVAGPSPYELAAEMAPGNAEALLLRRTQDANIREVRRLANLLLKLQRHAAKTGAAETAFRDAVAHDVAENKGA
ncbi:MAG: hypothetical protein ACLQVL_08390 [Terriglobia bacterium]